MMRWFLKMDFILFDFWYADHEVEDAKTMKDFDIFYKSAKIRLEGRASTIDDFENKMKFLTVAVIMIKVTIVMYSMKLLQR